MQGPVRRAVILAAGNGDRFRTSTRESKLLQPLLGRPILLRTIEAARGRRCAGHHESSSVIRAERVRALVERGAPSGLALSFA
jgi:CTP:molybdopterin cytidylyltransferase MocA